MKRLRPYWPQTASKFSGKDFYFYIIKIWIINWGHFCLKIQLIILRLFEANIASRVYYFFNLIQKLLYNCIFHLETMSPWIWFYLKNRDFTENFIEVIFLCLTLDFIIKCALNVRNRAKICVEQKGRPFEQLIKFITVFPVISVMKWLLWNLCYFFWFIVIKWNFRINWD